MSHFRYILANFEEILISILLPLMVVIIFVGTAGRYSQLFLLPWAEELARYLMIWVVFLGIGAGAKRNAHFMVEVLALIVPKGSKKYLRIFTSLFVAAFMAVLIYHSFFLIRRIMGMNQSSPSMGIPIWMVYVAIPVGCGLMAMRTLQSCYREIASGHGASSAEQQKEKGENAAELYE